MDTRKSPSKLRMAGHVVPGHAVTVMCLAFRNPAKAAVHLAAKRRI